MKVSLSITDVNPDFKENNPLLLDELMVLIKHKIETSKCNREFEFSFQGVYSVTDVTLDEVLPAGKSNISLDNPIKNSFEKNLANDAIELCDQINSGNLGKDKTVICQAILKASGNRAWAIYAAKSEGWWDNEVAEPCQAIMEAPGNQAFAISLAKTAGWWKDEVVEPCQAIMNAPGNRTVAIALAKSRGWWKDPQ